MRKTAVLFKVNRMVANSCEGQTFFFFFFYRLERLSWVVENLREAKVLKLRTKVWAVQPQSSSEKMKKRKLLCNCNSSWFSKTKNKSLPKILLERVGILFIHHILINLFTLCHLFVLFPAGLLVTFEKKDRKSHFDQGYKSFLASVKSYREVHFGYSIYLHKTDTDSVISLKTTHIYYHNRNASNASIPEIEI